MVKRKKLKKLEAIPLNPSKKLSFVVPIYKTEAYLKKCLESLLAQDYKNIEIICVADGESAKAYRIVRNLQRKDSRIVKYDTIEHGGACKARNHGYQYATGDYVSFWDSDCYAEPGMVRMWVKVFETQGVDFVYSGYRLLDEHESFIPTESFNKYLLTCNNYIATMFPMKRDIFPKFDENLRSLQDWDIWLTLSEQGYKGYALEGSGFKTEMREGISSEGCSNENWLDRYNTVREKHGIVNRDICFTSQTFKPRGIELAQMFGEDYKDMPSFKPHKYTMIYNIGFYAHNGNVSSMAFRGCEDNCKKVIHWVGEDVESIHLLSYRVMKALVETLNNAKIINFCENETARKMLEEIGLKAETLKLPFKREDVAFPEEFTVYYETDDAMNQLTQSIIKACPDIKFSSENVEDLKNYACFMSFTGSVMPSENLKRFLLAGRNVLTNYSEMYANNTKPEKEEIISKLREMKSNYNKQIVNQKAIEYYEAETNAVNFYKRIRECLKENQG